jgi:hypothetical protein
MDDRETRDGADLRALIRRYRVLWSILPKHLPQKLNGQRVGFDLELWGTHEHPAESERGECGECGRMMSLLNEIAGRVTPKECEFRTRGSAPVDVRMNTHPRSGFGRRVRLGVEVVCRAGYNAVRSECDAGCFATMREHLIELGARRI